MAQREYLGLMQSPDCRRYAPLSGEANYPVGAPRAELEACDRWAVQGKRVRVLHKATLPKPES
jgi:hypothetical protein